MTPYVYLPTRAPAERTAVALKNLFHSVYRREAKRMNAAGIPDPQRPGRVLNPFRYENPTFLPGDKVRDKRDCTNKVWRIVARIPHYDDEYIALREVGNDTNERCLLASSVVPHLEMVAMFTVPKEKP